MQKLYKCQDKDCGKTTTEDRRLEIHIQGIGKFPNRYIYKCPYCRGRLEEIEPKEKP